MFGRTISFAPFPGDKTRHGRKRAVGAMRKARIVHGGELNLVSDFLQSIVGSHSSNCGIGATAKCGVLAGLDPAIHAFGALNWRQNRKLCSQEPLRSLERMVDFVIETRRVDGRVKPGHDEWSRGATEKGLSTTNL